MRLCSSCFVSLMYKSGHSSLHWTVYTILLCVLVLDPLGVIVLVCWRVWNIWGHCVCWKSSGGFQNLQSYYSVQRDDVVVFVSLTSSAHFSGVSKLLVCVFTVHHLKFWLVWTWHNVLMTTTIFSKIWWGSPTKSSSKWLEITENWGNRCTKGCISWKYTRDEALGLEEVQTLSGEVR